MGLSLPLLVALVAVTVAVTSGAVVRRPEGLDRATSSSDTVMFPP